MKRKRIFPPWCEANLPSWEREEILRHLTDNQKYVWTEFPSRKISLEDVLGSRRAGRPLEYILGHCHVGDFKLKITDEVLVPRPETETLIKLFCERTEKLPPGPVVDCGTGSGLIAGIISHRMDRSVLATDICMAAVEVARTNRRINGWKYWLVVTDRVAGIGGKFSAMVANLPYVIDPDRMTHSVRKHEPHKALVIEGDPVTFYGDFLSRAHDLLKFSGEVWLEGCRELFELLSDQGLLEPWGSVVTYDDLSDRVRFLRLSKI